jgi:Sec-independent protein translocase protein TatA
MIKIIQKNRPHLAISSAKTYVSIIRNLSKQMNIDLSTPDKVIDHTDDIVEHFKDLEPKLRKTRLSALIVFLDNPKEITEDALKTMDVFRKQMMKDGAEYSRELRLQEKTPKQEDGWMDWNDIITNYKNLEKEVSYFKTQTSLTKQQFKRVQMFVLLSCLLLIPPRRSTDYVMFKIRNEDINKDNFMETKGRKSFFVFNTYKTAKKYGKETIEIPTALKNIINRWKLINKNDYLLVNSNMDKKINATQLNSMLYDYFNKPLSTSLIRHIFLSEKYKNVPALQEMQKTADEMGHSLTQALEYVKK